jgi:hypothetical protein
MCEISWGNPFEQYTLKKMKVRSCFWMCTSQSGGRRMNMVDVLCILCESTTMRSVDTVLRGKGDKGD